MHDCVITAQRIKMEKRNELPSLFFVYGTLRDDDDSGAVWTAGWTAGCTARNGKVYGFKLYVQSRGASYPFAARSDNEYDCVVGRIVTWADSETVDAKRKKADQIEGYDDFFGNTQSLFQRKVVHVEDVDNGGEKVEAIMYFQDAPVRQMHQMPGREEVPIGDWLQRKKP